MWEKKTNICARKLRYECSDLAHFLHLLKKSLNLNGWPTKTENERTLASVHRGRSQTTLTSFCLFLITYPPCWHFLPYKRWQKVDIFGPTTSCKRSLWTTPYQLLYCYTKVLDIFSQTTSSLHFFKLLLSLVAGLIVQASFTPLLQLSILKADKKYLYFSQTPVNENSPFCSIGLFHPLFHTVLKWS